MQVSYLEDDEHKIKNFISNKETMFEQVGE